MRNVFYLVRQDDSEGLRHGGTRQYRHFVAFVNGVEVQRFSDDSPANGYSSGPYLDALINEWVAKWETALTTKCLRAEQKGRVKLIADRKKRRAG